MGKMNVAYSDIFENLEAVINTDSDKPALSRVYDVSQSVVNKFKLNQIEEKDVEYNDFIKQTQNNLEQQRREQERLEQEKLEQQKREQERLERERERQEQKRLEQQRKEQEFLEQKRREKEKREKEKREKERLEQERQEQKRLEQEKREQERLERERQDQERLEQERLEQQKREKERLKLELEKEKLEHERLEQQRKEQEKLEKEKEKENQKQIDRIYQKLKLNTVKSTPIKTNGTKSLTNKLSKYYQKNQPKLNNDDKNNINNYINDKKLIISNIYGEILYEKLININEQINFNSVNLPSQYQHEQIDSIKFNKDKNSNDIINIVINKRDVDIKKVIYRKIIPVDENNKQLAEPIIQSVVFRGKYNIENDQNQWISQDLKFDEINNLPIIHGKSCDVDIIQPLTINVQAYEDKHEININVIYKDMYDLIDQDKDYKVIIMSQKSLNEIDRIEHMIIKCGYVRNIYTNKIYPIKITSHNQKSILNQLNKNSKYKINDFNIEGNRLIAYINDDQNLKNNDINKENNVIDEKKSQQNNNKNLNHEIKNKKTSKYKPVKKEIKDAFNKVDIPKAYQYNQYDQYKVIDQHINDMEYYNELNERYVNQFLKHINVVRKELNLSKMKKFDLDLHKDYQLIESLLKTNQNIVDNDINDTDTKIIDFCKEYMNKNNCVFDFIPLQRKVGVNSKLSPEYLADRDFEQIIKRINQFKEHRELTMDREINHIIRNKSYLLTSLFIKDIYDLNQSKANNKIAYNYSTIKIYS